MAIETYLTFNGNCKEAVEFYSRVFNTPLQKMMTFFEAPENPEFPLTNESKNLIMHTFLMISGNRVMFSDILPNEPFTIGNNISLTVLSKDTDEIKTYFNNLKKDAKILMDLQVTFWSKCYGKLIDKYGVCWQLSAEK
jgi:PhnB protein